MKRKIVSTAALRQTAVNRKKVKLLKQERALVANGPSTCDTLMRRRRNGNGSGGPPPQATATALATVSATPTTLATSTTTSIPTVTATTTATRTPTYTPTRTPIHTPTRTATPSPTATATATPTLPASASINECFDGIDNDGDGLIDMDDDDGTTNGVALGCHGPNWSETGIAHNGYTAFTPSQDTRILYVSDTFGDDNFDGLYPRPVSGTNHGPLKTITFATRKMRERGGTIANPGYPDWLLLDRCDDFRDQYFGGYFSTSSGEIYGSWHFAGRSINEPMLIGSYGSCTRRPRVMNSSSANSIYVHNDGGYLVITGIEFYAYKRDPNNPNFATDASGGGIELTLGAHDVLLEDNVIRFSNNNINLQSQCPGDPSTPTSYDFLCPPTVVRNIQIRKNVIADSYSTAGHSQGIFAENAKDVLIEGNVFDHNGWSEHPLLATNAEATIYNHNMYLAHGYQGYTIVRDNIVANGAATGIQMRVQGSAIGNLVLRNPLGITLGHDQVNPTVLSSGSITDNVVLDSRDIGSDPRGFGISTGRADGAVIARNIVAHQQRGTSNIYGIDIGHPSLPTRNIAITDNIVYDWSNNGGGMGTSIRLVGPRENVTLQRNELQQPMSPAGGALLEAASLTGTSFNSNRYFSTGRLRFGTFEPLRVIDLASQPLTLAQLFAQTSEQGAQVGAICYEDPDRDVASYMALMGLTATHENFMQAARSMSRMYHFPVFTAPIVNQYIRDGFTRCAP